MAAGLFINHDSHLCVSEISDESGQGYCQGGFSADFTAVMTASLFVKGNNSAVICALLLS